MGVRLCVSQWQAVKICAHISFVPPAAAYRRRSDKEMRERVRHRRGTHQRF